MADYVQRFLPNPLQYRKQLRAAGFTCQSMELRLLCGQRSNSGRQQQDDVTGDCTINKWVVDCAAGMHCVLTSMQPDVESEKA